MKLFIFFFLLLPIQANCETQVFEAVAKHEGEIAYYEKHLVVYDDQTLIKAFTEYFDPKGKLIGYQKSDFTHNLGAPNYLLKDSRQKIWQGLKWAEGKPEVFSRERKVISRRLLKPTDDKIMLAGPGLMFFISQNLQSIIKERGMDSKFAVPGRLEAYDFIIKPIRQENQSAEFEVKMKNWFLGIFSPRLKFTYDLQTKRLMAFEGLSNLRDEEGKMMSVDIQYQYEK